LIKEVAMFLTDRRELIGNALAGIAGGSLLLAVSRESLAAASASLTATGEAYWDLVKAQFRLAPGLLYFNNASLGPSPALVADATETFRKTLDSYPSRYMWGGWQDDKELVREKAATLLGASPEEIAITHNTTEGMNLVAASLELEPDDEVIVADHEHPSGTNPWIYWQEPKGVKLVRPQLPILPSDPEELVEVYRRAITPRTRVISICHMLNTNGMILPVQQICKLAHDQGILVAVDGAQSAAMIDFRLDELGCDFFATSAHKWLFSPKGVGILYARQSSQHLLRPLIVAAGFEDKSIRRLENYNTRNLPEVLGLGAAIDFHNLIGSRRKSERIYALKHYFLDRIGALDGLTVKSPVADQLSAGILTVEVNDHQVREVHKQLQEQYQIDCRPMDKFTLNGLRVSLSVFNTKEDIDTLVQAVANFAR
jgi:selenocysteine lyase/cysteine desulfurase